MAILMAPGSCCTTYGNFTFRRHLGHLKTEPTVYFEGISASHFKDQAPAEIARTHHDSHIMENMTRTSKEQSRLLDLNGLLAGQIELDQAAALTGVSERHTYRMLADCFALSFSSLGEHHLSSNHLVRWFGRMERQQPF